MSETQQSCLALGLQGRALGALSHGGGCRKELGGSHLHPAPGMGRPCKEYLQPILLLGTKCNK